jgi:hypothetical protein
MIGIGHTITLGGLLKQGSKIDEYLGLFSLKSRDFWVFLHDGGLVKG